MTRNENGEIASDSTDDQETRWMPEVQRYYDRDRDEDLTAAIVFTIAEAEGVPPDEVRFPQLYDCVDVANIEKFIFEPTAVEYSRRDVGAVQFRFEEYLVKVRSNGWIQVYKSVESGRS